MAQKSRSKEVWLIPKRVNLHQAICLIDGIIERKYSGTSWNPQKQNNLGVNLKKWGATNDGKNISPQGVRTLTASIPQYLGFLYINTNTTPNTICLTDAGMKLWDVHKSELVKIKNLREGQDKTISESNVVLEQMEKLQITNPIILKDCENILVFPFRLTLRLLLELDYLDREELAYIVFKSRDETEYPLILQEIRSFRKLEFPDRSCIINAFKQTHIGNITLVKAPSAGYYESLCLTTGIIEKIRIACTNPIGGSEYKLSAIKIKDEYKEYVKSILMTKYLEAEPYDFKGNLDLWIEYIGNTRRLFPPRDVSIINSTDMDLLIRIKKDGALLDADFLARDQSYLYPMFLNEEYEIEFIDINNGSVLMVKRILPQSNNVNFNINTPVLRATNQQDFNSPENISTCVRENSSNYEMLNKASLEDISKEILEHSSSTKFSRTMMNYLSILYNIDGRNREDDKSLRGAYYEYLFYKLMCKLLSEGVVDEIVWNGKVGKYGLPIQAPGGTTGTPDMVFRIDNIEFVLELTTIRPKSMQFKAEGASVPDHVRLYKNRTTNNVTGVFCAPQIHSRNTSIMQSSLQADSIKLTCITDEALLDLLKTRNRNVIKERLT